MAKSSRVFAINSISKGIYSVISSDSRKLELRSDGLKRAASFSWEKTARDTLNVIRMVAERR